MRHCTALRPHLWLGWRLKPRLWATCGSPQSLPPQAGFGPQAVDVGLPAGACQREGRGASSQARWYTGGGLRSPLRSPARDDDHPLTPTSPPGDDDVKEFHTRHATS